MSDRSIDKPRLRINTPVVSESDSDRRYDRRRLSYASTFENPVDATIIRSIEWMTGKLSILRMIRKFERQERPQDETYWRAVLDVMGIELQTPLDQLENIPRHGPLIVVANHPHGMVDGMVLAELLAKRRPDFRILTRSLLTSIDEIAAKFLIPVPFPHETDAQRKSVAMRARAMDLLANGGAVGLFPSGVVAASETMFGPAIEAEWNVFTAKMIRRSGATVVPIFFPGANSRWYQIANRLSATLRQSLLLHEVVHASNKPQAPIIGAPLDPDEVRRRAEDPRDFMAWLRAHTLSLQ